MKRCSILLALFLGILGFLISAQNADAYPVPPVSVGQHIYFGNGPGDTRGGEFEVYDWVSDEKLFDTFCLEIVEYIGIGKTYEFVVADISTGAINGGKYGGNPDPLDPMTAYLYHHFFHGTLDGYDYNGDRVASADALQNAIWHIENEFSSGPFIPNYNDFTILANDEVNIKKNWTGLRDVRVINLTDTEGYAKQDQITVVPEPATMLLFGFGLIGLAVVGRKKFQ